MSKESVSESEMSGSYDSEEYGSEMGQELPVEGRQVDTKNLLNYESDDSDDSDEEGMSDGE